MEPLKPHPIDWDRVVERLPDHPGNAEPSGSDDLQAPFGFTTRVIARWREARRDAALHRWARWSLRAALGSVAACAVLLVLAERRNAPILLPVPEPILATPASTP